MTRIFAGLTKILRFTMSLLPLGLIGCSPPGDVKLLEFKGARLGMAPAEVRALFPGLHPLPVNFGLAADRQRFQWYGCTDEDRDETNDCGPTLTIADAVPRWAGFLFSGNRLILLDMVFDRTAVRRVQAELETRLGPADGEPGNKTLREALTGAESVGIGVVWLNEDGSRIGLANYRQYRGTYSPAGEFILSDQKQLKQLTKELKQAGRGDEFVFFEGR